MEFQRWSNCWSRRRASAGRPIGCQRWRLFYPGDAVYIRCRSSLGAIRPVHGRRSPGNSTKFGTLQSRRPSPASKQADTLVGCTLARSSSSSLLAPSRVRCPLAVCDNHDVLVTHLDGDMTCRVSGADGSGLGDAAAFQRDTLFLFLPTADAHAEVLTDRKRTTRNKKTYKDLNNILAGHRCCRPPHNSMIDSTVMHGTGFPVLYSFLFQHHLNYATKIILMPSSKNNWKKRERGIKLGSKEA